MYLLTIWFNFMVNMPIDTQSTILETARKEFVQNGYAGTRMQEIADKAGINKAMLHYYFRSKEQLYHQIIIQTLDFVMPQVAKAMEHSGSFWETTEKIVETYINTLSEHPDIPIFIMSELAQQQKRFVEELKKRADLFPAVQGFMMKMMNEMQSGQLRQMPPNHLILNIMGITIFPFLAKPIFSTIFEVSTHDFNVLMQERKVVIMDFLKQALIPK